MNTTSVIKLLPPILLFASLSKAFVPQPYVGAEWLYGQLKFKAGYGENLFAKRLSGFNVLAGYAFLDYMRAELGVEFFLDQHKNRTFFAGETITNGFPPLLTNEYIRTQSNVGLRSPYVSVTVTTPADLFPTRIFLTFGLSYSYFKADYYLLDTNPALTRMRGDKFHHKNNKILPLLKIGIEHPFDNMLFSVSMGWKNTGRFNELASQESSRHTIKCANLVNMSAGLKYLF